MHSTEAMVAFWGGLTTILAVLVAGLLLGAGLGFDAASKGAAVTILVGALWAIFDVARGGQFSLTAVLAFPVGMFAGPAVLAVIFCERYFSGSRRQP